MVLRFAIVSKLIAACVLAAWLPAATRAADVAPEAAASAPRPFEEVVLESRRGNKFTPDEVKLLLEPVGKPLQITAIDPQRLKFQGLARVRNWTDDALLRFVSYDRCDFLRIHIWGEKSGVSLRIYPLNNLNAIAVYRTLADPGGNKQDGPVPYGELLATDDGRALRLPFGDFHLGHRDNAIVLFRGDIRLLTVPFDGPVKGVYVEAPTELELHDLAVVRAGPAPKESNPPPVVVLDGTRPAELPWKESLPEGASLKRLADGGLELTGDKNTTVALASLPLTGPGLYSAVFKVEDATPGSGVVLLNEAGDPLDGIEYGRERKGKVAFSYGTFREPPNFDWTNDENRPVSYAGPGQWLKLVVAGGNSTCWVSSDGVHWGRIFDPRPRNGTWRGVGIYAREIAAITPAPPNNADPKKPDAPLRRIRLSRVEIRELDGLNGAVSREFLAKSAAAGVAFKPGETVRDWTTRIAALAPKGCAAGEWFYACGLQILATQPAPDLLHPMLVERLENLPKFEARMRLLQDAALIDGGIRDEDRGPRMERWDRLGRAMLCMQSNLDVDNFQNAFLAASMIAPDLHRSPISASVANDTLLLLYAEQRWPDMERLLKNLDYWHSGEPRLLDWIRNQVRANAPKGGVADLDPLRRAANPTRPLPRGVPAGLALRQPLSFLQSRVATESVHNLQAAVDDKQLKEAARLFTASIGRGNAGLISSPTDSQLLASLVTTKRILLRQKELAEAVSTLLGPADQLKIQQVLLQDDPLAVEDLATQYYGTPAAASACQRLGDRALAAADFAAALAWYEQGRAGAAAEQQPDLAARIRLASAGVGKPLGEPPTQPVSFRETRVAPAEFEQKVRELAAQSRARAESGSPREAFPILSAIHPVPFTIAGWGDFDEGTYDSPPAFPLALTLNGRDWNSGQLSAVVSDDLLFVSKRRRLAAIELASGKTRWNWDLGNAVPPAPIRPLISGSKVFVRTMTAPTRYGLACLDKKSGRVLWLRDCEDNVVGDPQLIHGHLYALTIRLNWVDRNSGDPLLLIELNADTGDIVARWNVADAASQSSLPHEYQSTLVGDRLIVSMSGAVMCVDLQGRVQWARQSSALPPEIDPSYEFQSIQPPLESGGRLYLQQPGSWAVDCLSAETGELLWRRGVVGLRKILDLSEDRLLVKTARGMATLRAATGEILWQRELPGMLSATAKNSSGQIVCAQQQMHQQDDKSDLVFHWLDPATGRTMAQSSTVLKNRIPVALGPLVVSGDKAWSYGGQGFDWPAKPANIPIFELKTGAAPVESDLH